jgi:hypothetical protein
MMPARCPPGAGRGSSIATSVHLNGSPGSGLLVSGCFCGSGFPAAIIIEAENLSHPKMAVASIVFFGSR